MTIFWQVKVDDISSYGYVYALGHADLSHHSVGYTWLVHVGFTFTQLSVAGAGGT